jgi:hypothetical protein
VNIKVYELDSVGVIVDSNPIENPDGQFKQAQNATTDPLGNEGSVLKRLGFKKFNSVAAGGSILGGTPMAVAGTGGAPVSGGGGFTGDSTGTGDGTGAPGGTTDGGSATYPPAGASTFGGSGGGGGLFGGARLIVIGRDDNTSDGSGAGWYVTSKRLQNSANKVLIPGPPGQVYNSPPTGVFGYAHGVPMAWDAATGYLFYVGQSAGQATGGAVTIRKTNGGSDSLVATLPTTGGTSGQTNPPGDTSIRMAVVGMSLGSDGNIYLAVKLKASGQQIVGNYGAIWKLDPSTGALTQLNSTSIPAGTPAGYAGLPSCITYFNGSVFWGEHNLSGANPGTSNTQKDTNAQLYAVTSDLSYSVIEHGFSDGEVAGFMYPFPQTAPASNPSMVVANNQILFTGFGVNKTVPVFAQIYSRDRSVLQTPGAFTSQITATGGGAQNGNYWVSAVAFNDNLYCSFYNPGVATKIYKFVPDYTNLAADGGWSGAGTWSTVYTGLGPFVAVNLFVDDGVIYAIGGSFGGSTLALWSTDGTSWTDGSANLPTFGIGSYPIPVLAGFNQ